MEVSQINKQVTHAVIGAHATIECGITDNAEFFQVLSSSLYRYPELAVVREVICNAWDAHLEAGITKPVHITVQADKMIIRDFGHGIPHDKIGPIYGVYGNSTKKHDGRQTGGFGLGCKSPFAYTEHFGVTSWHGGIKTIYRMSKSSGEAMGKPGITPIIQLPDDTQTGLEVEITFNGPQDHIRFKELITRVVRNGGISATLNGNMLSRLPYEKAELGYLITQTKVSDDRQMLYVLYGNVIYPIPEHEAYQHSMGEVLKFMESLNFSDIRVILLAPPHSIAVAPSRETLSMQPKTIKTITDLLHNFHEQNVSKVVPEMRQLITDVNQKAVNEGMQSALLGNYETLPIRHAIDDPQNMNNPKDIAKSFVCRTYPKKYIPFIEDYRERMNMLKDSKIILPVMKPFYESFARTLGKASDILMDESNWVHREYFCKIMRKMRQHGLDQNTLHVFDNNRTWRRSTGSDRPDIVHVSKLPKYSIYNQAPYLRGIVILSAATKGVAERANRRIEDMKKLGHSAMTSLLVLMPRKNVDRQKYRDAFTAMGFEIIDLTVRTKYEIAAREANKQDKPVKEKTPVVKKIGWPTLTNAKEGAQLNLIRVRDERVTRTETPEFYYRCEMRKGGDPVRKLYPFDENNSFRLVRLFGDRGVHVSTQLQSEAVVKAGAVELEQFIVPTLEKMFWASRKVRRQFAFRRDMIDSHLMSAGYYEGRDRIKLRKELDSIKEAKCHYGMHFKGTQADYDVYQLILAVLEHKYKFTGESGFSVKMMNVIRKTKQSKKVALFQEAIRNNKLLKTLELSNLKQLIQDEADPQGPAHTILKTALTG